MKKALMLVMLVLASCQMSQEARQLADESFVAFIGAVDGREFSVDDSGDMPIADGVRYRIDAGPHEVVVREGGVVVMRQKIYAAAGQVVEIRVR